MKKDKQINFNISKAQKYRWEQYQEESHQVSSLAELIRQSVELYIETEGGREQLNSGHDSSETSVAIESELRTIQNRLDSLESTVQVTKRRTESDTTDKALQREIYASLPTASERREGKRGVAPEYISELVGSDQVEVKMILEHLVATTPSVQSQTTFTTGEPETRYWRRL